MSDKITPLEALAFLTSPCIVLTIEQKLEYINIIETALKELEVKREVIGDIFSGDDEKKYKALDIIKERFTIQFCKSDLNGYYGIMQIGTNPIYIKTKEEYDLLKEVLL